MMPMATDNSREAKADPGRQRLLTVPNVLCAIRLLGSPTLIALALGDWPMWCLGLFITLSLTDWLDGKLAKWLNQMTDFGARLDSVADVTVYACVLIAVAVFDPNLIRQEGVWIGLAVFSYAASVAFAFAKYRRMPSYHTRMAKTSWLLMFVAVIAVFSDGSVWAVRIAMLAILITNLESMLITLVLPQWRANVPSVLHARRAIRLGEDATLC